MDKQVRFLLFLVLAALLAGCGGGEATTTAPPAATELAPATDEPAEPAAEPTPSGPQATVVDVINQVDAHPLPEGEWQAAQVEMTIYQGGEVWAQEASTARVALEEGLLRVAPNTIFTFDQPEPDALRLNLQQGQAWIEVEGLSPEETFEVQTPTTVASVRGTRFSVRVDQDGRTIVSTQVGTVTVEAGGAMVDATAGWQTDVPPGGSPSAPTPLSVEEQVRWGMATGAGLDVVLPATGLVNTFSYGGSTSHPHLSPDGNYYAATYYVSGTSSDGPILYDLQAGQMMTAALPPAADGLAFNPAGDGLAYLDYANNQICTDRLDGSPPVCWGGDGYYGWPYWSPDGQWILFYSRQEGSDSALNLYTRRPDGSDQQRLTNSSEGNNHGPAWSPDGAQIAYNYDVTYSEPADLWVMNADGSDPQQVLQGTLGGAFPAWSPQGDWLAAAGFLYEGEGTGGMWLVAPDGSGAQIVSGTEGWYCWDPVWSPTASGWPLFFQATDPLREQRGRWVVTAADQEPLYLGNTSWGPLWTADGAQVAFVSTVVTQSQVLMFDVEPGFWP